MTMQNERSSSDLKVNYVALPQLAAVAALMSGD